MMFSKLRRGEGSEGSSPELQEMRKTVEKLRKTVEASQRKGKEQREMREIRGHVENLMAKCEQQTTPGEDAQTKTMRDIQAVFQQQLDQLRKEFIHLGKQPGPVSTPRAASPRRGQGKDRYHRREAAIAIASAVTSGIRDSSAGTALSAERVARLECVSIGPRLWKTGDDHRPRDRRGPRRWRCVNKKNPRRRGTGKQD